VDVEDGLFEPARKDVSRKANNLLGSDKGMYAIVY
jgi:hypothetical protein